MTHEELHAERLKVAEARLRTLESIKEYIDARKKDIDKKLEFQRDLVNVLTETCVKKVWCKNCDGAGELDSGYQGCCPKCPACKGKGYTYEEGHGA